MGRPSGLSKSEVNMEAEPSSASPLIASTKDVLQAVLEVQKQRAESYTSLNDKFHAMLNSRDETEYRQVILPLQYCQWRHIED